MKKELHGMNANRDNLNEVDQNVAHPEKIVDKIIGASEDANGQLLFFLKYRGSDKGDIVVAKEAHLLYPQLLLKWYEKRITWNDSDYRLSE